MKAVPVLWVAVWTAAVATAHAADLHVNTAEAFDRYVRLIEVRLDEEGRGARPFLWVDGLTDAQRREADARLRRGEVIVNRMDTRGEGGAIDIAGGLCHHWLGVVFLPSVGLDRVAALMQGYDHYHEVYRPAVRRSRLLGRDGDRFNVSLQLFMKKVISVVLNTENDVHYVCLSPTRMQVRSVATRIAEVRHPDGPDEQEKPVGQDNGFLWRFNNYCALAERDGGTYVQCETVSL